MVNDVPAKSVHVWHDQGGPLKVEALASASAEPVPGGQLYALVSDLLVQAGVDPVDCALTTWGDYVVTTTSQPRLGHDVVRGLDAVRAQPFIREMQVDAEGGVVVAAAYIELGAETRSALAFTDAEMDQVRAALSAAGAPSEGLTVTVVGFDNSDDSYQAWPAT